MIMIKISGFCILLSMLILTGPVFSEESTLPADDITLMGNLSEGVIVGKVTSVDTSVSTITIKTDAGKQKTFSVINGETILWEGIEDIELSDVSEEQEAEIGYYTNDSGTLIASWVDILAEETIVPLVEAAEEEKGSPKGNQKD